MIERNDTLNIKELITSEPKKEWIPSFDAQKELPLDAQEKILSEFQMLHGNESGFSFSLEIAGMLSLVLPEKFSELDLIPSAKTKAFQGLDAQRSEGYPAEVLHRIALINTVFSGVDHQFYTDTNDKENEQKKFIKLAKNLHKGKFATGDYAHDPISVKDLKLAFPKESLGKKVLLTNIPALRAQLDDLKSKKAWTKYAELASGLKILIPDEFSDPDVSEEIWRGIKTKYKENLFSYMHEWNPKGAPMRSFISKYQFIGTAFDLMVLSAEQIKFTENGIEITANKPSPKSLVEETQMPNMRRF